MDQLIADGVISETPELCPSCGAKDVAVDDDGYSCCQTCGYTGGDEADRNIEYLTPLKYDSARGIHFTNGKKKATLASTA